MFHQNSNDLVKNASLKSGHVQHSKETQRILASQQHAMNPSDDNGGAGAGAGSETGMNENTGSSLSIGAQFQNMIQGLLGSFSMKDGFSNPADSSTGIGGDGKTSQANFLNSIVSENKKYTEQELSHIKKVEDIMKLIERDDQNRRQNWAEVTDAAGITKYGYITKDGVFQIWHVPSSPSANPPNWLQTDNMKQNTGVIGCPAQASSTQKIKIAGKWDDIKPYDLVYSDTDSSQTNPLFMMINDSVRDPRNTLGGKGFFSCGNERGNVYVKERPSADFQFPVEGVDTIPIGCYVLGNNVKDSDLANRGFTFQEDLTEASISQCKRRAEDLGSSYFLVGAPEIGKPNNRGGCWVYTGSGKPNINGILTIDANGGKCHTMTNSEVDEDGFLKSYTTTNLKRMYGKNTAAERSVALYSLKTGGPTGVDQLGRGGRGYVGRIAYIDHNGERHDYPASALSFIAPSKNEKGETIPATYLNLGGYDTRSAESSYSLTEITPGSFSEAANLLYKASRDGWSPQKFHQLCDNKGPTYTRAIINDGRVLGAYTSLSWSSGPGYQNDTTAFLYDGTRKYTAEKGHWGAGVYATYMNSTYFPTFGGGPHDLYISGTTMYTNAYSFVSGNELLAPFTRKIQMANMYGPAIGRQIPTEIKFLNDGRVVYVCYDSPYTKLVTADGQEKYYNGAVSQFNPSNWNSYKSTSSRGSYILNYINQFKEFPRKGWGGYQQYTIQDIEVYSVDANRFPQTNPPDYARRLRTMPVGESVRASFEKCRGMCDADEKCGGFVYTKGSASTEGKCELKDRAKMYPVGLRVADPTKQLMLKVPTINGTISDESCKIGNGAYTMIDSAQYAHYPDTGAMTSNSKCNIRNMIPKEGTRTSTDLDAMFGAIDKEFDETEKKTTEYRNQTAIQAPPLPEISGTLLTGKEGMTLQQREDNFYTDANNNYGTAMKGVQDSLERIAKSKYQRERLLAITEESNKNLMSESYKFILWSILAILAVLALLKLKEMFGQDDADDDDGGGEGGEGGGLLATILGWFGVKNLNTNDIPDRTQDVKAALSSAGEQLQETGASIATGITEGADNLVNSANEMAAGAVEGAADFVNKAKETASNAIDQAGTAASSMMSGGPTNPNGAVTTGGGWRKSVLKSKKK